MADTAAASDGAQIELEAKLRAYVESHRETTPADLLRAFNVRSYLWPRLTSDERDVGAVVPNERVADCSQDELVQCLASWIRLREKEAAFRQALAAAEAGDTVLIAGKGHEDYQILGTTKHPFDDRVEAAAAIAALTDGEGA